MWRVNRLDVLGQPLALGLRGCAEASNAQTTSVRPCSSRRRISSAIRSTAPSTLPTCSAPSPLIDTLWPYIVAVGTNNSVARRTSSEASVSGPPTEISETLRITDPPAARAGALRFTEARSANDPAAGLSEILSAGWSMS